tara:strand:- start:259 stop:513 length:255 start_codon:yes stop_codon:yes gene_type:complete
VRKLTVDEIIQGLVNAYERLLKLEGMTGLDQWQWVNDNQQITAHSLADLKEYFKVKGEIKALRWVLGQEEHNIITEEGDNEKNV